MTDQLDVQFTIPVTSVVSVRANREEMRALTEAARFHGVKLSTYIKQAALAQARQPQVKVRLS